MDHSLFTVACSRRGRQAHRTTGGHGRMSAPNHPVGSDRPWPTDKLNALRLGQRLVTEVPASQPGRRAFIDITPLTTSDDTQARRQGWKPADHARTFRLQHWDYDAEHIDGFDYDTGAVLIRATTAADEAELATTLKAWQLHPEQFLYPWQTDDPR
ncbi:hypothetical protein [Actinoallomurus sp. CA-150999]|uniref:hypothetical protein n=1 Tax=Actinoallomurus sp. CA-150999 TaxID=3239887 RepID=UPI003D8C5730